MASFNLSWTIPAGSLSQKLYLKPKYSPNAFEVIAVVDGTVSSYIINGLQEDIVYEFKIESDCENGDPKTTEPIEFVAFSCAIVDIVFAESGDVTYTFNDLGGDIMQYDVILFDSTQTIQLSQQLKPAEPVITGVFPGLDPEETYYIHVMSMTEDLMCDTCELILVEFPVAPVLVSSPSSVAACDDGPPSEITLTAVFSGSSLSYEWYRNGVLITDGGNYSGATTNALTIDNAGSVLGSFVCKAINAYGDAQSVPAVITLLNDTTINVQPSLIPSCTTSPITVSVTAIGSTLTYQWQISTDSGSTWNDITGATNATYTVLAGSVVEGDQYRVKVNSSCGPEVTSSAATVDTVVLPVINTHPTNQVACSGLNATFTVAYTAEDPTATIWQRLISGVWTDLPGAILTSYSSNVAGSYRFRVTNACGTVYSNSATLTNSSNISWASTMASVTTCENVPVTMTNTVTGTVSSYAWAGSIDNGASWIALANTTNSLTLASPQLAANGFKYRLTAVGACNTLTNITTLYVTANAAITAQPTSQSVCAGVSATFSVTATGATGYQWQRSTNSGSTWGNISGATASSYTVVTPSTTSNNFRYRVIVTGCGGATLTSSSATLTVTAAPVITVQPASQSVCEGVNATFSVTATGAVSYQWQRSTNAGSTWTAISGATTSSYTVTAPTTSSNGYQYRVVVTGSGTGTCSTATSLAALLTVNNTTATWTNRDIDTYYVCIGTSKYYQQIDSNPCSATYNTTQTGALYQTNSPSCGYTPPPTCNQPTITSTTLVYVAPCNCPAGYTSSPDLTQCRQEVTTAASTPYATTFERTLIAKTYFNYSSTYTAVYTGGFNPTTGVPAGATITDSSAFWKNTTSTTSAGPMNRCGVWTNLETTLQSIRFSVCLNITQSKTYWVGVGCDNYISITLNGIPILTQDPAALASHWTGNSANVDVTFKIWHIYPIAIPAGNNVLEISGNNIYQVASVGVEIYDGTPAQILAAQSYSALGSRLLFSTKNLVGTQVLGGTDGVGYYCENGYSLKTCGLATPICYKVNTATCGT